MERCNNHISVSDSQIIKQWPPVLLENRLLLRYLLGILWKLPSNSVPICGNWPKCETGIS